MRGQHSPQTVARFADAVAEHGNLRRAASDAGISASYGRVLFSAIKRGLGWQAT